MIDWKKPYSTVIGAFDKVPRAKYCQNGIYFDKDGNDLTGSKIEPKLREAPNVTPEVLTATEDLESLHWTKLRQKLAAFGRQYFGKEDALEFLKNEQSRISSEA